MSEIYVSKNGVPYWLVESLEDVKYARFYCRDCNMNDDKPHYFFTIQPMWQRIKRVIFNHCQLYFRIRKLGDFLGVESLMYETFDDYSFFTHPDMTIQEKAAMLLYREW